MDRKKSVELKPWAIDNRARGKFRPWGFLGRGGGFGGGSLKIGVRLPNPTQPRPVQSPENSSSSSSARTHAHNRHAHAMGTTHSCCVNVMPLVSSQLAGRTRTELYGCARYSQLIRIIDCQACGTEGTEWRRRGPLSLCVCALPLRVRGCLSVLSVSVSVSASVFLHVLIVTRRSIRASTGTGGRARRPRRELQPDAGSWKLDRTRHSAHTDRSTHIHTNLRTLASCSWSCVGLGGLRPPGGAEGIGGGASRDSSLGCGGVEFFACF